MINSDADDFAPPKKKKKKNNDQPLIVAICTPMMARAHKHIIQSGEMVFLDSTSSLDRYNTSVFILSAAHPATLHSAGRGRITFITSHTQRL